MLARHDGFGRFGYMTGLFGVAATPGRPLRGATCAFQLLQAQLVPSPLGGRSILRRPPSDSAAET